MQSEPNEKKINFTQRAIAKMLARSKFRPSTGVKSKVDILKVIKTKGNHSWVQTDKGIFRKENKNIPAELFN